MITIIVKSAVFTETIMAMTRTVIWCATVMVV